MFLRNALYVALFSSALIVAGGRPAPEEQNGQPWNDENGFMDTTEVEGTVTAVDEDEQMLVVEHAFGEDTIYWDDQTFIPEGQEEQVLTEGAEVRVEYIEEAEMNIATRIELVNDEAAPPFGNDRNDERNDERNDKNDTNDYDRENDHEYENDNEF